MARHRTELPPDGVPYIDDLKRRLAALEISHNAVAREMGKTHSQFSRWTTGRVEPRISTVQEIESAIHRIVSRRERENRRKSAANHR